MKYDVLHNFISPVTGRVLADRNHVLYGNAQGVAIPSPILTDVRLDLMNLRKDYEITSLATFVLNTPNEKMPNAQALSELTGELPRILKANIVGIIEVAVQNTDYATIERLEELADEAEASKDAAEGSAANALISASTASEKASLAAASATRASNSAGAAAGSATSASASAATAGEILIEVTTMTAASTAALAAATLLAGAAEKSANKAKEAADLISKAGLRIITTQNNGIPGAAGASGVPTLLIDSNINLNGARIENIAESPKGDYDAITTNFAWNLINDNVEIRWQ